MVFRKLGHICDPNNREKVKTTQCVCNNSNTKYVIITNKAVNIVEITKSNNTLQHNLEFFQQLFLGQFNKHLVNSTKKLIILYSIILSCFNNISWSIQPQK